MGVFEMVVAIVALSCAAGVFNNWVKNRSKVDHKDLKSSLDSRQAQIDRLEKRIRVLERIVTDQNYDLKKDLHELENQ